MEENTNTLVVVEKELPLPPENPMDEGIVVPISPRDKESSKEDKEAG